MPYEVATSMLTAPGAKLTNRMRKVFRDARSKVFVSTLEKKPIEAKVTAKMSQKTYLQLQKIYRRAVARRQGLQDRFIRLEAMEPPNAAGKAERTVFEARKQEGLALLNIAAAGQDMVIEAAESALTARAPKGADRV